MLGQSCFFKFHFLNPFSKAKKRKRKSVFRIYPKNNYALFRKLKKGLRPSKENMFTSNIIFKFKPTRCKTRSKKKGKNCEQLENISGKLHP